MTPILFALISLIGWGTGDILIAIASRKIGGYSTAFWLYILALLIFSLFIPSQLPNLANIDLSSTIILILLTIISPLPFVLYLEALRIGNAALVGTIVSSFVALVVLFSIVFLNERINFLQATLILIIFIGIILSSLDIKSIIKYKLVLEKSIVFALISMLIWGVYFTFIKIPVSKVGWFWPNYLTSFAVVPFLLFMKFKGVKIINPLKSKVLFNLIFAAILVNFAAFSYNAGIRLGLAALVAPIAGAYPPLFVLLAFLIFKDPITKQQILGIVTTLIGIVLLSFLSA